MAKDTKIKGIVIEIGGNTTKLQDALKDVDKATAGTTSELRQIDRALKFDTGNVQLLGQKFDVITEQVETTSTRLKALRASQAEVERMFANGEIDAKAYREFNRDIEITESQLRMFKAQLKNIKAEIEVDTTQLDTLRNRIRQLPDEAKQAAKEIGKAFTTGLAVGAAGLSALTLGMTDTNKDLSRLYSQANSTVSSKNKTANNIKTMTDAELKVLETALSEQEKVISDSQAEQLSTIEKSYSAKEKALQKSLNNEVKALEKVQKRKLELIDKEYLERIKLIDDEEYKRLKAIDNQIAAIEKEQNAIDELNRLSEEQNKRFDLQSKVENARTKHDKKKASESLAQFEQKLLEQQAAEERKLKISNLKEEQSSIKDANTKKRDALKEEFDARNEQINASFEAEKEKQAELQTLKTEQLALEKENYIKSVQDRFKTELDEYKKMSEEKVKIASTPVATARATGSSLEFDARINLEVSDMKDSRVIFESVRQETDQQTEALGNLVRAGYETQDELTRISKNIGGIIQLYGATFNAESLAESITTTVQLGESTGQLTDILEKNGMTVETFNAKIQEFSTVGERANYISELLASQGMTRIYDEYVRAYPEIINASQAQVEFIDALHELTLVLTPLLTILTEVLTVFAKFAAEHEGITKAFAIVGTVVGVLGTAFAFLLPLIISLKKLLPHLLPILKGLFTGVKIFSGPIGWIITAVQLLIRLVPSLIRNWSKVSSFFVKMWKGISSTFGKAIAGIGVLVWGIVEIFKLPLNNVIKMVNEFTSGLNKIKIPDWIPVVGGKYMAIPQIPMLAKGTDYFKGGSAIVGENGPELVNLPTGAKVHNANKTSNLLQGSGEITINVPLQLDGRIIAEATARYTNKELYKLMQRDLRGV